MTEKLKFHSWLQGGMTLLSDTQADEFGRPSNTTNTLNLGLKLKGHDDIRFDFSIQGPGDIAGINTAQILKVEPKNGTPDFEPNYFPFIEFTSPEFPWLFSPTKQGTQGRIKPWLALVALKSDDDFSLKASGSGGNQILSIHSGANLALPKPEELYAWAHIQESSPPSTQPADFKTYLSQNPQKFISRLICPAKLSRNTPYKMFLVPSFEAGRLAGLGQDASGAGFADAWTQETQSIDLPVFYQWSFTTGSADIEELLRRLKPYPVDETVGLHDLDITNPRGGLSLKELEITVPEKHLSENGALLTSFKGALVSPIAKPRTWPKIHKDTFQKSLNLFLTKENTKPKDRQNYDPLEHDPVVTPPIYGKWQSDQVILKKTKDDVLGKWMTEMNLDPSHRAVAGLGAKVIRTHQEDYMAQAWEYARNVREVQKELRKTRMALTVSTTIHSKVTKLSDASLLQLSSPMHRRITGTQKNDLIFKQIDQSNLVPSGLSDSQFRRSAMKQQKKFRVKKSTQDTAKQKPISRSVTQYCIQGKSSVTELAVYEPSAFLSFKEDYTLQEVSVTSPPKTTTRTAERRGGLRLGRLGQRDPKLAQRKTPIKKLTVKKTVQLEKGKLNLKPQGKLLIPAETLPLKHGKAIEKQSVNNDIDLTKIARDIRNSTNPIKNLPDAVFKNITGLQKPKPQVTPIPKFANIEMEFDEPTYVKMQQMEPEFFMPGFGAIPDNSVSIVEANPEFIESYLAGLNHEMSREFAWREYPALLNQTWFKSFWNYIDNPDQKDIENIHKWQPDSKLGSHAYGFRPNDNQDRLVLLIKGDLLRRYPNISIYAVQATWKPKEEIQDAEWHLYDALNKDTPEEKWTRHADLKNKKAIELPVFKGHIANSAHFLGFNLNVDEVVGSVKRGDKDPGWFFVFEEHIEEPRFGLDTPDETTKWGKKPANIEDLSWGHMAANENELNGLSQVPVQAEWLFGKKIEKVIWGKNSAQMARLTYQNPVRMMFHADSLIAKEKDKT